MNSAFSIDFLEPTSEFQKPVTFLLGSLPVSSDSGVSSDTSAFLS